MTAQAQTEESAIQPASLAAVVGRVAAIVSAKDFPTGERAMLKRMTPTEPPPLAFFRFAFRHLPEGWERQQAPWKTLLAGIALMCPHPHRPETPAGQALAEAGYAESRLERLLAAEGETLHTLLLRAARFLRAKQQSVNWADLARLVLASDSDKRESARLHIARHYYSNLKEKE